MRLITFASSSSGNCTLVSQGNTHVLIDAGISFKRITEALRTLDLSPSDISAVVVTHAHTDHIGGLRTMCKHVGATIFAAAPTLGGIEDHFAAATCATEVQIGAALDLDGLEVNAFRTSHDSPGSVGYTITYGSKKLAFATDLGIVTPEVLDATRGATTAIIEANHDITMLKNGHYPPSLKRRVLSDVGHLSNRACGDFAVELAKSGTRRFILAHLSQENNTPYQAETEVRAALTRGGFAVCDGELANSEITLTVASRAHAGGLVSV